MMGSRPMLGGLNLDALKPFIERSKHIKSASKTKDFRSCRSIQFYTSVTVIFRDLDVLNVVEILPRRAPHKDSATASPSGPCRGSKAMMCSRFVNTTRAMATLFSDEWFRGLPNKRRDQLCHQAPCNRGG